jgi:hypothetical protein
MLLQYLQIIIVNEKVTIWLFCKTIVTLTSCFGSYVVLFLMERYMRLNLKCHLFINNFEHDQFYESQM